MLLTPVTPVDGSDSVGEAIPPGVTGTLTAEAEHVERRAGQ